MKFCEVSAELQPGQPRFIQENVFKGPTGFAPARFRLPQDLPAFVSRCFPIRVPSVQKVRARSPAQLFRLWCKMVQEYVALTCPLVVASFWCTFAGGGICGQLGRISRSARQSFNCTPVQMRLTRKDLKIILGFLIVKTSWLIEGNARCNSKSCLI